jgi:hypothetical protein
MKCLHVNEIVDIGKAIWKNEKLEKNNYGTVKGINIKEKKESVQIDQQKKML